jgi:hypothetical protein
MPSKEERRKELEAELAALDDPGEDESFTVEYWEEGPDGTRRGGSMPYSKGKAFFAKWAPDLFGDKPAEGEPAEGEPAKDDEPGKVQRFGRRVG